MDARGDRPLRCRRVERIVLQSLREVRHLQPSALLEFPKIDQQLMGYPAIRVLEPDVVVWSEPFRDVVRVEQGNL